MKRATMIPKVLAAPLAALGFGAACAQPARPITENQEPLVFLTMPSEARVGDKLLFSAEGTRDVDGEVVELRLEPGDESAPVAAPLDALTAEHTFAAPGLFTVAFVATDDQGREGRARRPLRVTPALDDPGPPDEPPPDEPPPDEPPPDEPDPLADDDGDGISNGVDAAPSVFNGLRMEAFAIESIPRDLLSRQKAEDVVDAIDAATPLASADVTDGWSARDTEDAPLSSWLAGAPDRSDLFALRFTGTLTPPAGAAALEVEVGADDLCVVLVDGVAVASADEEFARDFLRADRVPALSGPIELFGPVELAIVVANDGGPYAWDVALRFLDADGAAIPDAPSQSSFRVP